MPPGLEKPAYDYCDVSNFPALPDHVYRNDGGRFVDVTQSAGIVDQNGRGLGVIAADLDDDGKIDIFVTNDTTANYFFHNEGGFRFTEAGMSAGLSASEGGTCLAGMGIACGDFDGDGRLDLAVTNFFNESTTLYHNHGQGFFSDRSSEAGLYAATRLILGFGLAVMDANNDGRVDLVQANGHVFSSNPAIPSAMRAQLFLGQDHGKLVDVSDHAGPPWKVLRFVRGLAVGDLDNDGRTDAVMVSENAPLAWFQNQTSARHHFLVLELEGTTSNRDAVGAKAAVTAGGKTQVATRFGGGSFLSASGPRLHFGLGTARKVDRVVITWPSGRRDCYQNLEPDQGYRLREGGPAPRRLPGHHGPIAARPKPTG